MNTFVINQKQKDEILDMKVIPPLDGMITAEKGFMGKLDPERQRALSLYRGQLMSIFIEIENELIFLQAFSEFKEFGNALNGAINERAKIGFVKKKSKFLKWFKKLDSVDSKAVSEFQTSIEALNPIRDALAHHTIAGYDCPKGLIPFIFDGRKTVIFDLELINSMQDNINNTFYQFAKLRQESQLPLTETHQTAMQAKHLNNEKT